MVHADCISIFDWIFYWCFIIFYLLFYYISWLFFIKSGVYSSVKLIMIGAIILYFTVFLLELYQSRGKINICKKLIKKSIEKINDDKFVFSIGCWIGNLKKSLFNSGLGLGLTITLYLSIPVIIAGFFGGHPQVSAKTMLNNKSRCFSKSCNFSYYDCFKYDADIFCGKRDDQNNCVSAVRRLSIIFSCRSYGADPSTAPWSTGLDRLYWAYHPSHHHR